MMALVLRPLTAGQLANMLIDVAQATLYRHIKLLVDAGLLRVVEEHPMRGTIEKVYALAEAGVSIGHEEAAQMSREDHLRSFVMFVTTLIGDFERYLQQEKVEPSKEMSYHKFPIYLSDEELIAVSNIMNEALLPLLSNSPGEGRKRRIIASIMLPDADEPSTPDE